MKKKLVFLSITLLVISSSLALTYTLGFKDVTNDKWYWEDVHRISDYGIMSGFPDGTFKPDNTITRAEMAAIMINTIDYIEESRQNEIEQSVNNILSTINYSGYIVSGFNHGAGVLIDDSGLMLTAYHVVESIDGLGIRVSFADSDRQYPADLVYKNEEYDLALIQVYGAGVRKSITFSKTEAKVLDKIYAIGNPFGLKNSISSGIISKLDVKVNNKIIPHIQMDITINGGNSGGAIVGSNGELVGIACSSVVASENGFGIGFAIGLNEINEVIENYKKQK